MNRFRSYVQRVMVLAGITMLLITAVLYIVSSWIVRRSYEYLSSAEITAAVRTGAELLDAASDGSMTKEELDAALNPLFNPGDAFLVLFDTEGSVVAASNTAEMYCEQLATGLGTLETEPKTLAIASLRQSVFLRGERTERGYVIAGISQLVYEQALTSFRAVLRGWVIPPAVLMLILSLVMSRIFSKPADVLVDAAQKLSDGELVQVSEKLPPDLKPIGRAFNNMSHRLGQTIGALRYERDTMQLVLEGLHEGVMALDEAGDILHMNKAAMKLLDGRSSALCEKTLQYLRSEIVSPQEPLRLTKGEHILLITASALPRENDEQRGAVAMIMDITEQERLERTRRDYVANISHELRTPLTSMRGIAEALRDGLVTDESEKQRYYEMIVSEIRRLSRLVNDLLELSSLQSNPAAFETESVTPAELLYDLADLTAPLAAKKNIELKTEWADDLPDVITNEDRLQQVLTILLDNAVKFTQQGSVTLGAEPDRRGVRFYVRDTGVGMNEQDRLHAFDRFHQADRSHRAKGSGLGLAIAGEIMKRMDVEIRVKSEQGKGSEFSFVLPAVRQ